MDGSPRLYHFASPSFGGFMIVLGLLLLIIGFITGVPILWSLGVISLVVGLVLWVLGSLGHAIGGRRHYF
jgi:hypothetical protein